MLPLEYPGRWRTVGVLLPLIVMSLALAPAFWPRPDDARLDWVEWDKLIHGITFALLALWYTGQYARSAYWRVALGLSVYGLLIEWLQSMLSYRTAEAGDLVADVIGIAIGIVIALIATGGWSQRAENWLKNRIG